MTAAAILSSIVLVAIVELIRELSKKWRSKPERESETIVQMREVVNSYVHLVEVHKKNADDANQAYTRLKEELDEATVEVIELRSKVHALELSLSDAHVMISRMMDLAKIRG